MTFEVEFEKENLKKLAELRKLGINPYGGRFDLTHHSLDIIKDFERLNGKEVRVAGRLLARRDHGKLKFFDLRDEFGDIQLYVSDKELDERSSTIMQYLDIGDIIGASGKVTKTKAGQESVVVHSMELLSKALLPLPPKWYGLEDTEKRYRKRYLDFAINMDSREKIKKVSMMLLSIRKLLADRGFIEVTVPALQPIPGGTNAKPFVTRYNALDRDFYLKIASELYLKRLLVGGFEKVFDISLNFRNEGIDTKHNPEFLAFELYQAYGDLSDMLNITEEIVKTTVKSVSGAYSVPFGEQVVNLEKFSIKTMEESVFDVVGKLPESKIMEIGKGLDKKVTSYGEALNAIFEEKVQRTLVQPTFITRFPIEISPLAKKMDDDPRFVYRFELYIAGMEVANAFSELNDPIDQIERFKSEAARKERGIDETQEFDRDFVEALGHGMPPAGGVGIGLERLFMIATSSTSIKSVIAFPQLRTLEND